MSESTEPTTASASTPPAGAARRERVLSGMRPTGALHLGHYHGALKNWVRLQADYECFYFVADWHALTTHYEERGVIEQNVYDMVIDWLAAGIDPDNATIFIQSRLPEHAELFTLLAMGTPLGWLERVPTYKDQMDKLKDRDLATYGFLGYPLLQAADILIYKAAYVPVGEDQSSHVELTREVARRFNHLYGREPNFEELARNVVKKLGKDAAVQIAYKGGGEAALALLSGDVDFSCGNLTSMLGSIKAGKLRGLVTTTPERLKDLPDVPTAREVGYPQLEAIVGWSALYGPPGMSADLINRWVGTLAIAARDPQWISATEKAGSIPRVLGPAETEKFAADQFAVYERLGRQLQIELK